MRHSDGSARDANYGVIGRSYSRYRQPEPGIAAMISDALGAARTVLNVGAGAGSYEPTGRQVTAVEPSASMRDQRPPRLARAIDATAESLPIPDQHFDASMATFTIHQWSDLAKGLGEMRRVTRGPVVIFSCDPGKVQDFWLNEYAPEVLAAEAKRYPAFFAIEKALLGDMKVIPVPIPFAYRDGFNEAYYGRPEMLLDDDARLSCSAWSFVDPKVAAQSIERLKADIGDGSLDRKFGHFNKEPYYIGSLYLLVSQGVSEGKRCPVH